MTESSDERPRPAPRPRPTPRARVAGSRREREEAGVSPQPVDRPVLGVTDDAVGGGGASTVGRARPTSPGSRAPRPEGTTPVAARSRHRILALVLALLCVASATGLGLLLWERTRPPYVDASVFAATRSSIESLYAFDYQDAEGSVQGKLDVLTGDLRDQYEEDLAQGGIIDTYKQVSATTSYEVLDVGLQQINDAQDTATVVVFGQYVAKSVTSGQQAAPQGSECLVTPEGAQSCTQTIRVTLVDVDGEWKINELTVLTTS